ncbi:MAG: GTPase Era [Chitinispirillaceae bacterium]|nr:GTPase Era [Chitinispirillaceae bacterium]
MTDTSDSDSAAFRSAFIALIGRPNSGKSTLLNTVIGSEISIVSAMPQTTRCNARGIYTTTTMQLVFVDTPGVHIGKHTINKAMLHQARTAAEDAVDLICYLVDLSRDFGDEEAETAALVSASRTVPVVIVFNKTDLTRSVDLAIGKFYSRFPQMEQLPSVRINATAPESKELFLSAIDPFISPGPLFFDPEDLTDSTLRQIASEYLRKQVITVADREVPHAVFVEIEDYREEAGRHSIIATIHVETRGQRGILVGKNGTVIARIKKEFRTEMTRLTGVPTSITCHIKVSPRWRDSETFLRRAGMNVS